VRPASWDARRLARRLACRVTCTPTGAPPSTPNVSRRSAHPRWGVSEAKRQSPDAAMRARKRDALFDIVKVVFGRTVYSAPSSPRKRGPMITGRWLWVPALRPRARASAGTTAIKSVRSSRRKTRDTRKTRTGISRTATPKTVPRYRRPLFSIDRNNEVPEEEAPLHANARHPALAEHYLCASLSPARAMPT
jgi:hypothetical protein